MAKDKIWVRVVLQGKIKARVKVFFFKSYLDLLVCEPGFRLPIGLVCLVTAFREFLWVRYRGQKDT